MLLSCHPRNTVSLNFLIYSVFIVNELVNPLKKSTSSLNLLIHSIFIINKSGIYNLFISFRLIVKYLSDAGLFCKRSSNSFSDSRILCLNIESYEHSGGACL